MYYKVDYKLLILWMLLLIQILLVIFYFVMTPSSLEHLTTEPGLENSKMYPITFVQSRLDKWSLPTKEPSNYLTEMQSIELRTVHREYFTLVNSTVCFIQGTDLEYMEKLGGSTKCECKQGWHGKDCGQPEVIWRAFMASQQKIFPRQRKEPRRLIHAFSVLNLEVTLIEIKIRELSNVVDLFIVCESNYTENGNAKSLYFRNKLKKGLLHDVQHKILYIPVELFQKGEGKHLQTMKRQLWKRGKRVIRNLQPDDILVLMDTHEIPNTKALLFFKLYDSWPQPVSFRLRWSVYGYFWQHPKRTITAPGAWSVQLLEDYYHSDISRIPAGEDGVRFGLVVGDLNHYGGWFCEWCLHPYDIVLGLQGSESSPIQWNRIDVKKIDTHFVEELVGSGFWFDSSTALIRKYQYKDQYFAPSYVLNNTWKYEFLLTNIYQKNDYN